MNRPQTNFLPVSSDYTAPVVPTPYILSCPPPGEMTTAELCDFVARLEQSRTPCDDPLPLPPSIDDDDLPDTGPVSPTTLAASYRAGQRHVDAIRNGAQRPAGAPQGVPDAYKPAGVYCPSQKLVDGPKDTPEDAAMWARLGAYADDAGRVRIVPGGRAEWIIDTGHDANGHHGEPDREAMGNAGIVALAVACAMLIGAVGVAAWGVFEMLHRMGKI